MDEEEILVNTINLYDSQAQIFFDNTTDFLIMKNSYDIFLSKLKGRKILDIGSGSGRDMSYFFENGYDIRGVELSKGLIKLYPDHISSKVIYGDMREIDIIFVGEKFDGIRSCASLVHMSKERAKEILVKSYDLLNIGGILFISVKYLSPGKKEEIFKESITIPGFIKRYTYWGEEELKNYLEEIGFVIENTRLKEGGEKDSWLSCIAIRK